MTRTSGTTSSWALGIDVGGTFTDIIAVNRDTGETLERKVLTTPGRLEDGVLQGISETGVDVDAIHEIVHGHTAGINAVVSRKGANAALIATAGHRDLLDIGRMEREFGPNFYDPTWLRPHQERPIIRRRNRFGVVERVAWDGTETFALDKQQLNEIAEQINDRGIESVAICFVNSYISQDHEQQAAEIIREQCPGVYIQTSAIYPVTKESERTTTIALDAYVGPIVTNYLSRLEASLGQLGFTGSLWIMTMNGGVASIAQASRAPVFQLQSGPVGGVSGAVDTARTTERQNLLTVDIGGTTSDVAVVQEATPPLTDAWSAEHGIALTMPVVDVRSVGSGAGSIIHIDSLGTLTVGPQSAGAEPGPACYGRGGQEPTLTDAALVLGVLQPDLFAGGAIKLDTDLARTALARVADPLGMDVLGLAEAAYRLASSDIAGSIRAISTYRGLDLREFTLMAFGAAGPMVANQVARDLGVSSVIVPPSPGEFSASGLLRSDLRVTRAQSPLMTLHSDNASSLAKSFDDLEAEVGTDLSAQGVERADMVFERALFVMYEGQTWDNRIPLGREELDDTQVKALQTQVHDFYRSRYGYSAEELPIVVTTVEVTGVAPRQVLPDIADGQGSGNPLIRETPLRVSGDDHARVPVYDRGNLAVGREIQGPAIIAERYATTVVDARSVAFIDSKRHLCVQLR